MKISTSCINVEYDKAKNIKKYYAYIEKAASEGAQLIVFPEQSLQGYLPSLTVLEKSTFRYQYENAETVPDGPSVQAVIKMAKEKNIYIIFGMTEKDDSCDYKLYNTMVLVGPDGYVGKYRKVHLPLDELHVYYAGEDFPVYNTAIGKIGMLICYDKAFPESARELALNGAEILVMSTAWPFADSDNAPNVEKDDMFYLYDLYDKVRALENQCFFISSNQTGVCGQTHYIGCSNIVSPDGKIITSTGYNEGIAYACVDIKKDIYRGKTEGSYGLNLFRDRNPAAYKHMKGVEPISGG